MATVALTHPQPNSPGTDNLPRPQLPETLPARPPSPSAAPTVYVLHDSTTMPSYERRDSGASQLKDERSYSASIARSSSPPTKRTDSVLTMTPSLASAANLSSPSFHPSNRRNSSPESRPKSAEDVAPTAGSSAESSPQPPHSMNHGGGSYHNGQHINMRTGEHQMFTSQEYAGMMRPKKRHKTSRACDECRRKKVSLVFTFAMTNGQDSLRCYFRSQCRSMLVL